MRTKYTDAMPKETRMNTHLGLAIAVSATLAVSAAWATENEPVHHHHYRHTHHVAHPAAAPSVERPGQAVETAPPSQFNQMFKPYPHPGDGDDDGLSRDPDDCMKGCIGGNPG
jgi:hypothetical protein